MSILSSYISPLIDIDPTINTQNPEVLKNGLLNISINNIGDDFSIPGEKAITGLKQSLQDALPNSIVFLITDDEANDWRMESEVLEIIQRKHIMVYVLIAEKCVTFETPGCKVYLHLTLKSNGHVFNIGRTRTTIQSVLDHLKRQFEHNHVSLKTTSYLSGGDKEEIVTVDGSMQELCAGVKGDNARLTIVGPNQQNVELVKKLVSQNYNFGCVANPQTGEIK